MNKHPNHDNEAQQRLAEEIAREKEIAENTDDHSILGRIKATEKDFLVEEGARELENAPKHADHIDDEDEKQRRKWAEFIINNPDVFYAALKGVSVATHKAEIKLSVDEDFSLKSENLTLEEQKKLDMLEVQLEHRDRMKSMPEEEKEAYKEDFEELIDVSKEGDEQELSDKKEDFDNHYEKHDREPSQRDKELENAREEEIAKDQDKEQHEDKLDEYGDIDLDKLGKSREEKEEEQKALSKAHFDYERGR